MRNITIWTGILALFIMITACEEQLQGPLVKEDSTPPGPVELEGYFPIPGGFVVSYKLPDDEDLLYVKAEYNMREDRKAEVKASVYQNNLTLLGFGDTLPKTVKLYAVDRSANVSESVEFTESPLEAPLVSIQESMSITPDYGGARFTWGNPTRASIAVMIYAEDSTGVIRYEHTVYNSMVEGKYSIRGYNPEPTRFYAVVRDRWDNLSEPRYPDTPDSTIVPLFEQVLDKGKFRKIVLPGDANWDAWAGDYTHAYDDETATIVHTLAGAEAFPQIFTIDLGVKVKLSRFRLWQRMDHDHFAYTHGAPYKMDVYGSLSLGDESGNLDDWMKLRDECVSVKPSGLPLGQYTDEDLAARSAGDEFTFDEPVEIRYLRLLVNSTWDGAAYCDWSEITLWGDVVEEYN